MTTRSTTPPANAAELLQLVMDHIPQSVFWKDRNSVFLGCNQKFARAAGVSRPEDILGKTDFDLPWRPEEAAFFQEVDRRVMASGQAEYRILEPLQQADGRQAWIETNKIPLRDAEGRVMGILGTYEDVTDRVTGEERLRHAQRMESIGELAGGLAHDFNNLLTGVIGMAETLHDQLEGQPGPRHAAGRILSTAGRAADLTRKLLAFSRRGRLQSRPVNVHALLEDVCSIVSRSLGPDIDLQIDRRATRFTVHGDPTELQSALLDLALNAREALPEGGTLRIRTEDVHLDEATCQASPFELRPGPHVCLEVHDTGHGMPPEVQARIFEPFFTTKPSGEGTGLGLAAAYGVVLEHHGAIEVQSAPGMGTRFRLLLPSQEAPTLDAASADTPSSTMLAGEVTVLVVDDEDVVRETAEALLATLGYRALAARDGVEAVEIFRQRSEHIDLVLLDMRMPRMGGKHCLRELRAIDPRVRVVISSGFTEEVIAVDDTHELSADGFLNKPYRRSELSEAIRQVLG